MIHAMACGKIILFGEHAVVYDHPGIAVPVRELSTIVSVSKGVEFLLDFDREITDEQRKVIDRVIDHIFHELRAEKPPVTLHIQSSLPMTGGLGSSASLCIALIKAIGQILKHPLTDVDVNHLAYHCERIFHGSPSGIDNTTITYEKPVYFHKKDHEFIHLPKPLPLLIVDSGEISNTMEAIQVVKKHKNKGHILREIGNITEQAKEAMEKGDLHTIGHLMKQNHAHLQELGVSTPKIDEIFDKADRAGAYGAKLTGGGMGGNVVILVDDPNDTEILKEFSHMNYIISVIV